MIKGIAKQGKEELKEEIGVTSKQIKSIHLGEIFHRNAQYSKNMDCPSNTC